MLPIEDIVQKIKDAVPGSAPEVVRNPGPAAQHSIVLDLPSAVAAANFLRAAAELQFDLCSNVTGVDWLDRTEKRKIKSKVIEDGAEKEIEQTVEEHFPGYLEAVYHLYSTTLRTGPLVIRLRAGNREVGASVPSLTPVYRGAEFQEREIYDLYGLHFDGHPDLRRILMWDEFKDHPMRKDYVQPDDYEYEPTPHDAVLARAKEHYPSARPASDGCEKDFGSKVGK